MSLFLEFFSAVAVCGFACVFEGGFGKRGVFVWCFCGELVVECVLICGDWVVLIWGRKTRHFF